MKIVREDEYILLFYALPTIRKPTKTTLLFIAVLGTIVTSNLLIEGIKNRSLLGPLIAYVLILFSGLLAFCAIGYVILKCYPAKVEVNRKTDLITFTNVDMLFPFRRDHIEIPLSKVKTIEYLRLSNFMFVGIGSGELVFVLDDNREIRVQSVLLMQLFKDDEAAGKRIAQYLHVPFEA
jgi:hypothetical protein